MTIQKNLFKLMIGILTLVVLFALCVMAFINFAPQFGAKPSGEHLQRIAASENYRDDQFINLIPTKIDYSLPNFWGMIREYASASNTAPKGMVPTGFDQASRTGADTSLRVTWFGHSAILLELEGKRIFLDPMLGPNAAPVSFFGKRFKNTPAIRPETIDSLDAVIFSHDHYDHLDYHTIRQIHQKVGHFFTPLGVGSHLQAWGVPKEKITELDWWEEASLGSFTFIATPARHFSGRGMGDANKTLWASWVLKTPSHRLYFSGDSGYGPHFREIGEQFGPFDFAMMECGQYNLRWEAIHMMPEQSIQASKDVRAEKVMPIHWGAFTLAPHVWTEPVERALRAADSLKVRLITPEIGLPFSPGLETPDSPWWKAVQ